MVGLASGHLFVRVVGGAGIACSPAGKLVGSGGLVQTGFGEDRL
jgi:hypothetical protein